MPDPSPPSIDCHLPAEIGSVLEERFWRPEEDGSSDLVAGVGGV